MTSPSPAGHHRHARRAHLVELLKFGTVGAVAFVVDLGVFNLLRFGPGELLEDKPLTARVLAVAAATVVSWLGNRSWAFRQHRTTRRGREFAAYAAVNVVGIVVQIGALALSHYVLHLTSPLADNVATVVGIGIATVVRYVGYKFFVFTHKEDNPSPEPAASVV